MNFTMNTVLVFLSLFTLQAACVTEELDVKQGLIFQRDAADGTQQTNEKSTRRKRQTSVAIQPDVNQTVINSGEDLELQCSYTEPVNWLLPGTVDQARANLSYWQEGSQHKTSLRLRGAVYSDTGSYECLPNSTSGQVSSSHIYVYVRDRVNLFVQKAEFEFLAAREHDDFVIPCRVTSPDVHVVLLKNLINVPLGTPRDDGLECIYDPTVGVTVLHMAPSDAGFYDCIAVLGSETERAIFLVDVMLHTISVPKPKMENARNMHVEVGDILQLQCWVQVATGVEIALSWEIPDKRNTTDHAVRIRHESKSLEYRYEVKTFLTIQNVTRADEGRYSCHIQDHNRMRQSTTTYLTVHERNATYLNLSLSADLHSLEAQVNNSVLWVVLISAHPEAQVHWYSPAGNEINNSMSHMVTVEPYVTTLYIPTVQVNDSGVYMISASNSAATKSINVSLTVHDS